MSSRLLVASLVMVLLIGSAAAPAPADIPVMTYTLAGSDAFAIAARHVESIITYTGIERLARHSAPGSTNFNATVTYEKNDGTGLTRRHAEFALAMAPDGTVTSQHDGDPDYLTILNQPFSVQLDAPTMRDLHGLSQSVPFDFPSPMTGAPLHGTLRRLLDGTLNGDRVLGIAFSAQGPLEGTLPDRPSIPLSGTITMNGTAYYAYTNALLLALDATLLIEGKVGTPGANDAVTITYKRTIRPIAAESRGR